MKDIYFKSINILSFRDKKGFSFDFAPDINIITGENDTGKSSLIKNLYHTLGADIRLDKKWKDDDFISKVVICINNRDYAFIRYEKRISIFDITENEIHLVTSSSRSVIAMAVRDLFDFNLSLVIKTNLTQGQALPASLYLPYYIDQDSGWGKILDSFSSLAMYKDWQSNILNFHTGVKPKEYYTLLGELNLLDIEITEIKSTLRVLDKAKERFENSFGRVLFDVDIDYYETLLERFINKCQLLHTDETKYRIKLIEALSLRDELAMEIEEAQRQLEENSIDKIHYTANLESRYAIFNNRDKLLIIIPELYEKKSNFDIQINKIKLDLKRAKYFSSEINSMLREVKEEISLQEIIRSQASKQVEITFDEQINELLSKLESLNNKKETISKEIKKYEDKRRTKEINDKFKGFLKFAQTELGIKEPKTGTILQYGIISKSETGSRAPRAILAYHYALLKTIEEKSTASMLPIVIDSPKQQDPDPYTAKKLFDLCINGLSTKSQLIIGSVSLEREISQFRTITMTKKYSLLSEELYNKAYQEIIPLYTSTL